MVYQRSITLSLLCSACVGAWAAPAQDHFKADLSLESVVTDNALKTADNGINERQDTLALGLDGQQNNRYSNFKLAYSAERSYFSEQSQQDTNTLEGDALWVLGKEFDWFNLTLQDSRRKVLTSNTATPLLSNTGERELMSIEPQVRLHVSKVDQIIIGANHETVRIKRLTAVDAKRDGADLIWQHNLSPTDQLSLSFNQGESTRQDADEPDYKYQIARLGYQARLSHLNYALQLGYQNTKARGQEAFSKPNYSLDLGYEKNGHSLSLGASSAVTDTLFGDGNGNSLDETLMQDSLSNNYDLVKLTQASLNWMGPALWHGLRLSAQAQYANHDYFALPEDYTDRAVSVSLNYSFAAHTRASVRLGRSDSAFKQTGLLSDYQEDNGLLRISHDFTRALSADFLLGIIKRHSDDALNEYSEQRVGVSARYQF